MGTLLIGKERYEPFAVASASLGGIDGTELAHGHGIIGTDSGGSGRGDGGRRRRSRRHRGRALLNNRRGGGECDGSPGCAAQRLEGQRLLVLGVASLVLLQLLLMLRVRVVLLLVEMVMRAGEPQCRASSRPLQRVHRCRSRCLDNPAAAEQARRRRKLRITGAKLLLLRPARRCEAARRYRCDRHCSRALTTTGTIGLDEPSRQFSCRPGDDATRPRFGDSKTTTEEERDRERETPEPVSARLPPEHPSPMLRRGTDAATICPRTTSNNNNNNNHNNNNNLNKKLKQTTCRKTKEHRSTTRLAVQRVLFC
ncbi:hypothetical protein TKK_0007235 [Trichogramma kaykai]